MELLLLILLNILIEALIERLNLIDLQFELFNPLVLLLKGLNLLILQLDDLLDMGNLVRVNRLGRIVGSRLVLERIYFDVFDFDCPLERRNLVSFAFQINDLLLQIFYP